VSYTVIKEPKLKVRHICPLPEPKLFHVGTIIRCEECRHCYKCRIVMDQPPEQEAHYYFRWRHLFWRTHVG
jgi:hypothetical protein